MRPVRGSSCTNPLNRLLAPLLAAILAGLAGLPSAQAQPVVLMHDGVDSLCNAVFYDSGYNADHGNGEYSVLTFCPGIPGALSQVAFLQFQLGPGDVLNIYDGPNTGSPLLASGTGTSLAGTVVASTTGCLTFEFTSDAAGVALGWEAQILCDQPCAEPTAVIAPLAADPLKICPGETVAFDGSGSFAAPGRVITSHLWHFGDGTTGSLAQEVHAFPAPGEYTVTLSVTDDIGCVSVNYTEVTVRVGTVPELDVGLTPPTICAGETATLVGATQGTVWTNVPLPFVDGLTILPDGSGVSYTAGVNISGFPAGTQITSGTDITQVCLVMEHSYIGDLSVTLTCPNGTSITLFDEFNLGTGPGNTYLGDPDDLTTGIPGIGWQYCFSNTGAFGPISVENAAGNYTTSTITPGNSMTPGNYTSEDPFTDFVGCDLNGNWTLTITDNLYIDDGFIFSWWIEVDPALYPAVVEFTPSYGPGCDSTYWSGPDIVWQDPGCDSVLVAPAAAGTYDYLYTVTDDHGCTYDTTLTLTVTPSPTIDAVATQSASCSDPVQLDVDLLPPLAPGVHVYQWTPAAGLTNPNIRDPLASPAVPTWYVVHVTLAGHPLCGAVDSVLVNPITVLANDSVVTDAACQGEPGTIQVITTGTGGPWDYTWTDAANDTVLAVIGANGSSFNGPAGTYTVVIAEGPNGNGCTDTVTATITEPPAVTIALVGGDTTICRTGTAVLNAVAGGGSGGVQQHWSNGLPGDGPHNVSPGANSTYSVFALDANGCSSDTLEVAVTLLPFMNFSLPDTVVTCPEVPVGLTAAGVTGGDGAYSYDWGAGPGPWPTDTVIPTATQTICMTLRDGCETPAVTRCTVVEVTPIPPLVLTADSTLGCEPFAVQFTVEDTTGGAQVEWDFGDGVTVDGPPQVGHAYGDPGAYDVTAIVTWPNGCTDTTTAVGMITVLALPQALFSWTPQPPTVLWPHVQFHEESGPNAMTFDWDFAGLGSSTATDPLFTFPSQFGGSYPVTLVVANILGCADSTTRWVEVRDELLVYVPNTFTPDGDGLNEVFRVIGNDIDKDEFQLLIFDRWGEVVFSSTDPAEGWNGTVGNGGGPVVTGVYPWRLRVASLYGQEKREIFGHVTVLK
ncbi:MAG: hypothetical protein GFGODING_02214 [Flavobacteriales bacterium]|nr:hypothetical protein [Flavobacteriales bacterium]